MNNTPRPYIICHMMSTIDGKIDSGIKGKDILGDYYETYSILEKELNPEAWMCGRVTSEMFAEAVETTLSENNTNIDYSDFKSSNNDKNYFVAVDTKGVLRWKSNTLVFGDQSIHALIIAVTEQTPFEYLTYLRSKNISYMVSGENELDFQQLFEKLKREYEVNTLLLEGGALLNGSVMKTGLIDEISLLITPLVLNRSNAPSIFENDAAELDLKKYQLSTIKQIDNAVWLRYKK